MSPRSENEGAVVQNCLELLRPLDDTERARVLRTVATYFDVVLVPHHSASPGTTASHPASAPSPTHRPSHNREPVFSGHEPISPKEFLRQKKPKTDVERAACLAYYLAHYRDVPSFKTADIAKLNTEAAQRKFANSAYTVNNAANGGYFVAAPGGNRQLSAMGEQYVETLPDREAAVAKIRDAFRRRKSRKTPTRQRRS